MTAIAETLPVASNYACQQEVVIMPFGAFVNHIPPLVFLVIHLVAFSAGALFAYRAFTGAATLLGWGFSLYAVAEIVYMTYHLDWTVFLFAHTIAEVLDLGAFALIFAATAQRVRRTAHAAARP